MSTVIEYETVLLGEAGGGGGGGDGDDAAFPILLDDGILFKNHVKNQLLEPQSAR
jgi:hypothetical protein